MRLACVPKYRRIGKAQVLRVLRRFPPFTNATVRVAVLRWVRSFRRKRRDVYERVGSDRLSRPGLGGLDTALARYLPDRPGFFVEAGANDGYRQSNTYYLERFCGWAGVLIEPVPALCEQCRRDRPNSQVFNYALAADTGTKVQRLYVADLMTGQDEPISAPTVAEGWERQYVVTVPARTLTDILDAAGARTVDFLSLDIEGHELAALRGLDLDRYQPAYVLIETNGMERELDEQLGPDYHQVARLTEGDVLWARC